MDHVELDTQSNKSSVTITQTKKVKGTTSDIENKIVVKQYYDGDISQAKRILKEYDPTLPIKGYNEVEQAKNMPSSFEAKTL